jgi:hypothetical protein
LPACNARLVGPSGLRETRKWLLAHSTGTGKIFNVRHASLNSHLASAGLLSGVFWLAVVLAMCQVPEKAGTSPPQNTRDTPVLVELFTSEGCSSCPPADVFLQKLDQLQPIANAQLIVLSEHVDYWDHDGWKDPNSSPVLTDRQAAYERALGLSTPYTPQIIVDGAGEMHISDAQQIERALQQAAATPKIAIRLEGVGVDLANPALLRAHVVADENTDRHNADVYLAVALNQVDSQVLRGENGGRRLHHTAVVQQLVRIGKLERGQRFALDVQIKLNPGINAQNLRVVAFAQIPGPGKMLGAALWKTAH